jgi:hypothetical protein
VLNFIEHQEDSGYPIGRKPRIPALTPIFLQKTDDLPAACWQIAGSRIADYPLSTVSPIGALDRTRPG